MTILRPTSSPIKLPRALRAALLGAALFSGVTATAATGQPTNATPAADSGAALQTGSSQTVAQPYVAAGSASGNAGTPAETAPAQNPLQLEHPRWDYKDEAFFKRISEYFTGRESAGYRILLRTDPQVRSGLYFQALLSKPLRDLPEGTAFRVRFIRPDATDRTVTHTFAIPADLQDSGKTQLWLGFTGTDTPPRQSAPVAWQISIVDAEGQQLAETHSFLWSERDAREPKGTK